MSEDSSPEPDERRSDEPPAGADTPPEATGPTGTTVVTATNVVGGAIEPFAGLPPGLPEHWLEAYTVAAKCAGTKFVPAELRGSPHEVLACILTGHELGIGSMQALRMVHMINGRPSISAELMRALVNRAGHKLSVDEAKQDSVTVTGVRRDTGATATVTWTLEDAKRAQLMKNPTWAKYPRSMLLARASSELCRMLFADVVGGLYAPEETAAIDGQAWDGDDDLVDPVTQQPPAGLVAGDPY